MQRSTGRLIHRYALIALLAVAAASSSLGDAQEKANPAGTISIKQILDKNVAAMNRSNTALVQTLEVSGRFAPPPLRRSGDFRFFYKSPGSCLAELDFSSHGQVAIGRNSDGRLIFHKSANALVALNGVTIFMVWEAWQSLVQSQKMSEYQAVDLAGLAEIEDGWAYAIRFVPRTGDPLVRYYDSDTFLLRRMQLVQRFREEKDGPDKAYKVEIDYNDYKSSNSVTMPRSLLITQGRGELAFRVQSVRVNVPIDDAKFAAAH